MRALLLLLLLLPSVGFAQCVGSGGINTLNDCPQAVSPLLGDELLAYQISQSPNSRKMSPGQILGLLSAGSGVTISTVGNSVQISAISGVTSGLANQLAWYTSNGSVVSGLTTANNGVLVTSGAGVPSIGTTLPDGLALGTPLSLTLTNASGLPVSGLTGLGTGVATALGQAVSGTGRVVLATSGTLNSPTLVTPALGTPSALVLTNATGLPNAGLLNSSTTVNGVVCALGSTCAITATAASITVGSTSIVGGTPGSIEYNNSGTLGELTPTGSGNVVLSTSPTLVTPALGTPSALILTNASGTPASLGLANATGTPSAITLTNGTGLPIAGVTGLGTGVGTALAAAVSGSGGIVLATSPTLVTPALGTPSAVVLTHGTGLPNAGLINAATTVNGQTCTLGSTCTITASAGSVTVGTTTISGGTNGRLEYNNSGVLGELATTGSGNVVLATSPTLVTPNLGTPASGVATNLTGTAAGLTAGNATTATNLSGGTVAATTLSASGAVSGAGFTALLASPGPIGSTSASTGAFTALTASTAGSSGNQVVNFSQFNPSLGSSGYTLLPGGLILQWGTDVTSGAGGATVVFPLVFPNSVYSVTTTFSGVLGVGTHSLGIGSDSASAFQVYATNSSGSGEAINFNWTAIGH